MTATTPATPGSAPDRFPDPGFGAAVRSEWTKLWTAKGPRRNLVLGSLLGIGLSMLLALAVGATFSEWPASERVQFDPTLYSLSGAILASIFFVAVGVRAATSEYTSGMIRLTLTATPRRHRVLFAKALVVAAGVWIFAAVTVAGMIGGSQLVFAANDLDTTGFGDTTLWRIGLLAVFTTPLFPILGVVAGFLFRSTAAAITSVLALLFGPSFFGGLFPGWWQENVLSLLPGSAVDAATIGDLTDSPMHLSTAPAALVSVAWLVVPLLVARQVLVTRDV